MRWLTCSLICSLSSIGKFQPERVEFSLLTFNLFILKYCKHPCLLCSPLALTITIFIVFLVLHGLGAIQETFGEPAPTVDEIFQLATAQLRTLYTKYKRDCIYEIRFSSATEANNGGEVLERSDDLVAPGKEQWVQPVLRSIDVNEGSKP
jgi:hypothetical protein